MDFLGIPLFENDFYKMIFHFAINIFFLYLIVKHLYGSSIPQKGFVFTYYMIGIIVFFLCFTLKKYELDLGMALGLFAIFGIIRYRTSTIEIKEMTYLFIVIGVSVINSLANQKMSYAELLGANTIIVFALYLLEKVWTTNGKETKTIKYENLDNIKPENEAALRLDLEERTGLKIDSIHIGNIDYVLQSTTITITYKS